MGGKIAKHEEEGWRRGGGGEKLVVMGKGKVHVLVPERGFGWGWGWGWGNEFKISQFTQGRAGVLQLSFAAAFNDVCVGGGFSSASYASRVCEGGETGTGGAVSCDFADGRCSERAQPLCCSTTTGLRPHESLVPSAGTNAGCFSLFLGGFIIIITYFILSLCAVRRCSCAGGLGVWLSRVVRERGRERERANESSVRESGRWWMGEGGGRGREEGRGGRARQTAARVGSSVGRGAHSLLLACLLPPINMDGVD